jgi:hypothetical protein
MRRVVALFLSLGLLGLLPVASVSAAECSTSLVGFASLKVDTDANTGEGVARVWLGGVRETVTFDSEAIGGGEVIQHWYFADGMVTLHEYSDPQPIGSNFVSINSPVGVDAGGVGDLYYAGTYNLNTTTAKFVVSGVLCIGG